MTNTGAISPPASAGDNVWRGAAMNGRVIVALIFREAALRFGSGPIVYIWTLVEPAILLTIVLFLRTYIRNMNPAFGDSSIVFLLTGLVALRATRQIINRSYRAIGANRALFRFGAVKPIDVVLAKTILEFTIWLIILTAFFAGTARLLGQEVITNFQGFMLALLQILYFCIAMSLFTATVGALIPVWRTIWKMLSMPLMIASGVLYIPAEMPPDILNIITWNPFLHCVEGLRSNSYLDYISVYRPYYLLGFSTTVLILSLSIESFFRREIMRANLDEDDEDEEA